jgi:hypothetical protein
LLPLAVFLLAFSGSSFAQKQGSSLLNAIEKHDVGIFGGGATYLGDFNEKDLLYRLKPIVGVMYRYNFNPYFALRGQAGYTRIEGSSKDYYGDLPGFPTGGSMKFNRSMVMIDGVFELNFLPFSPTDKRRQKIFSPYLALGVGVNFMGTNSYNNNPQLDIAANTYPELYGEPGKAFPQSFVLEIPVGFGVKVSPVKRLTIAGEWTFKKMFYDDIDGFTNRGGGSFNLINDDWVSTITVSLTYRFASNWKCDAYRGGSSGKLLKGLKARTYKVNVQQSAAKDLKKGSNVKMLEGRSENDSNRLKKKKRK